MQDSKDRHVFLIVILLLLSSFVAGQLYSSGVTSAVTSAAVSRQGEVWDFEQAETTSEYWEVIKFSIGDDMFMFIMSFIGVFAVLSIAGATLTGSEGTFGSDTTTKGAMAVFAAAGAFITSYMYSELIVNYLSILIPIILIVTTARYLKGSGGGGAGWTLVTSGIALIAIGAFLVFG